MDELVKIQRSPVIKKTDCISLLSFLFINAIWNSFSKSEIALIPEAVEISSELIEEERTQIKERYNPIKRRDEDAPGPAFHEKSEKNQKENLGGSYKFKMAAKYKKRQTRGDKNYNRRNKK